MRENRPGNHLYREVFGRLHARTGLPQLLGGFRIGLLDRAEDSRDFAHTNSLAGIKALGR